MTFDIDAEIKRQMEGLDADYDSIANKYDDAQEKDLQAADANRNQSVQSQKDILNRALNEAYIVKRTSERDLGGMMAVQGMSGGASETAISSNIRNYQNARNVANADYATNKSELDAKYNQEAVDIGSRYAQMLADLEKQQMADAVARANQQYQAYIDQENMRLQQEQWEWEKQMAEREYALQQAALASSRAAATSNKSSGSSSKSTTTVDPNKEERQTKTQANLDITPYWVGGAIRY